jgi:hypothetical protein
MTIIHDPAHEIKNERQLQSVSDQLSSLELPEPSVITKLQLQEQDRKVIGERDVKLSSMSMSDPEGKSIQNQDKLPTRSTFRWRIL